jgi:hypothetical protein
MYLLASLPFPYLPPSSPQNGKRKGCRKGTERRRKGEVEKNIKDKKGR